MHLCMKDWWKNFLSNTATAAAAGNYIYGLATTASETAGKYLVWPPLPQRQLQSIWFLYHWLSGSWKVFGLLTTASATAGKYLVWPPLPQRQLESIWFAHHCLSGSWKVSGFHTTGSAAAGKYLVCPPLPQRQLKSIWFAQHWPSGSGRKCTQAKKDNLSQIYYPSEFIVVSYLLMFYQCI